MVDFINSIAGLVLAIAMFIGAVTAMLVEWRSWLRHGRGTSEHVRQRNRNRSVVNFSITISCGILSLGISLVRFTPSVFGPQIERQVVRAKAFNALENARWEEAVRNADEVITEYAGNAVLEQEKLERDDLSSPPTGKVPMDQRKNLFGRGLLNDVAACYFIKGRALERLGRINEARQVYQKAKQLSYGRVYDPGEDVFWSPAEASEGRLRMLPP